MADPKTILLAIDDFGQSKPLIDYVAALIKGSSHFQIHLFHAAGPLPPNLLESTGAENPTEEIKVEQKQERAQDRWAIDSKEETQHLFDAQIAQLASSHFPKENIVKNFVLLHQRSDLVPEIISAAQQNNCGTIIVGYGSYSWVREQFQAHIGEQLISQCHDTAVCVVRK
jgi:hypothetical protein